MGDAAGSCPPRHQGCQHPLTAPALPAAFRSLLRIFRAGVRRGEGKVQLGFSAALFEMLHYRPNEGRSSHCLRLGERQLHPGEWGPATSTPSSPLSSPDSLWRASSVSCGWRKPTGNVPGLPRTRQCPLSRHLSVWRWQFACVTAAPACVLLGYPHRPSSDGDVRQLQPRP